MSISHYIRDEVLRRRLKKSSVLVIYDSAGLYRELCQQLADDVVSVVDASERGIESREAAMRAFAGLGEVSGERPKELLIYVPASAPQSDEAKVKNPFAAYTACGNVFPDGDGDDYLSLCLKAKPDHGTEIRSLFEQDPSPSFELVDNIGGGVGYPTLRTLLNVDSSRNILLALLVLSERQKTRLRGNKGWLTEVRALLMASLGLKLPTKGKSWSAIADELWRFLLYSEFVFDSPEGLPASLDSVPHAAAEAMPLVEDLCETLRSDTRTRQTYIERAEQVERDLKLPEICTQIDNRGRRDTFPFEERNGLAVAVRALKEDRLDAVRDLVDRHRESVWLGRGESQAQWGLMTAALYLVEECDDAERGLADHVRSLGALTEHYAARVREVDRLQREFEQAVGEYVSLDTIVDEVTAYARRRYAKLAEKLQSIFTKQVEAVGWPPQGRFANAEVFDRLVAPLLAQRGHRVAYFMVDALRYELGLELHRKLLDSGASEIVLAYAQFPTITSIGMASLLPGAGAALRVERDGNSLAATLDGRPVGTVAQRMAVMEALYGDRFAETTLTSFVGGKKVVIPETVDLMVLRSTEIDSHLENNPDTTLGLVHQTLRAIRVAVHRLKAAGFSNVIIATDHGFFLNGHAEAGDLCAKPPGNWVNVHDRSLLGEGTDDTQNFAVPTEKVGIRGDFARFAAPRSMAPYRRGLRFFHGGPSLQEAIVPVLTIALKDDEMPKVAVANVKLSYKNGAKRITTRLPVVDLSVESGDMFSQEADFEILLEAHNKKGAVVGEAKKGDPVDPATGTLKLRPGEQKQITIRMDLEFEGKFTLKALDPVTMTAYATIDLETDYAV
jgi:hypothetical protein